MTSARKIGARGTWYLLILMIWLVAVALLLELSALFIQIYIERTNPLIGAYRNGSPLPVSNHPVVIKKEEGYYPAQVGGWHSDKNFCASDSSMQQVLEWGLRDLHLSVEEHQKQQYAFANLTDSARNAYAVLHGELVFAYDSQYRLQELYGAYEPLFSGVQGVATHCAMKWIGTCRQIRTAIHQANRQGTPQQLHTTLPVMQMVMLPVSATCCPAVSVDAKGVRAYVFCDMHPEMQADFLRTLVPQDSRWDIPYYRSKAGMDGAFQTNSFGFRSREAAIPKPEGVFRILCIGGSTTEEGSTNETTYSALLEARLRQRFSDKKIEVVNAGTSGISSDWHLLRLPEYLRIEPDLVIFHLGVNDLWRQYNSQWAANSLANSSHLFRFVASLKCIFNQHRSVPSHTDNLKLCLELMTILFQQRGIAVAYASIACPVPDNITKEELQFYNYQANSEWKLPTFSLRGYNVDITASNNILRTLSQQHNAFYIPVAEQITGGGGYWHLS